MTDEKFSITAYANQRKGENRVHLQHAADVSSCNDMLVDFSACVSQVRSDLVAGRGTGEEDKQRFSELLNRAILGYELERKQLLAVIHDILAKHRMSQPPPAALGYETLAEAVFAELIGMGALEVVLKHKEGLEEIQVVGCDVYEVRKGQAALSSVRLMSLADLERIQQNLVLFNNESLNPRKRWAEVRMRDGSRVTLTGFGYTAEPTLTIRFYTMQHYRLHTLTEPEYGTLDENVMMILLTVLRSAFNLVIIGPTNSGKTNLMKALIAEIADDERIITIESRFELMLKRDFPGKNIVEYEVDEDDPRHSGAQAFKLALRQSPRRIVHAEIRDEDANLYVRACTRGHQGSMTTVHVSELEDAPDAIADMCMLDGRGMDSHRLTKRITEYVTQIGLEMAVVHGKRRVVRIGEYAYAAGEVTVRDIVRFDEEKGGWLLPGSFSSKASGRIYKHNKLLYGRLKEMGMVTPC